MNHSDIYQILYKNSPLSFPTQGYHVQSELKKVRRKIASRFSRPRGFDEILGKFFKKSIELYAKKFQTNPLEDFILSDFFDQFSDISLISDTLPISECFYQFLSSTLDTNEDIKEEYLKSLLYEHHFSPKSKWANTKEKIHTSDRGSLLIRENRTEDYQVFLYKDNKMKKMNIKASHISQIEKWYKDVCMK